MSGEYIHGTDAEGQRRLSRLNVLVNDSSLAAMGLGGGERVLDVGSGLGQFARAMARTVGPEGRVVGVERDPEQLQEALRLAREDGEENLVVLRPGDASALPLSQAEWGRFDVAHARFVLEHVPDPLQVVRAMVNAVRPGGRILLEDDDHDVLRLWPEPPGMPELWRAYMEQFRTMGNDPLVGRRLLSILHEAGARPVSNDWLFFGSCAGNPDFDTFCDNFAGVLTEAKQRMLSDGHTDADSFAAAMAAYDVWRGRPDATIWYGRCWAEGARPPAPGTETPARSR
jgi:ubiquinone/menaquinone biosynthesis C-methylase UbiE